MTFTLLLIVQYEHLLDWSNLVDLINYFLIIHNFYQAKM